MLFAGQICYILSMGLCRVSVALFVAHAERVRRPLVANVFAGLSGAWTLGSLLAVALRGDPRQPWATMDGTMIVVSASRIKACFFFLWQHTKHDLSIIFGWASRAVVLCWRLASGYLPSIWYGL